MYFNSIRLRRLALLLLAPCLLSCGGKRAETLQLESEADLTGLTLSTSAGNYYYGKYSGRDDIKLFPVNSESDGVEALRQGIADVFVTDEVSVPKNIRERLGIKIAFRGAETFDVAFAIRKGNDALREDLDAFIARSLEDGSIDAIISHWVNGTPAPPDPVPGEPFDGPALHCITSFNMEPVCFLGDDGRWQGFDADILRRFAIATGRKWEMDFLSLGSAIMALNSGQADVVNACLYVTEERKRSIDFSIPYYHCRPGYFVLEHGKGPGMSLGDRIEASLLTEGSRRLIVEGLVQTVLITFFSILLGSLLGIAVCAALRSRRKWVRRTIGVYGTLVQGTPVLVLLLIMFYVVFANAGLSGTIVAIITFSLFFAWSSGGIFDSSISSVPRGQVEAGLGLGFTPFRTFTGIVFPQALKFGLRPYTAECVSLLKSTSIVGYIAIQDLTRASDLIRSRTFDALLPLLVVTVIYFILAWLIRLLLKFLLVKK